MENETWLYFLFLVQFDLPNKGMNMNRQRHRALPFSGVVAFCMDGKVEKWLLFLLGVIQ